MNRRQLCFDEANAASVQLTSRSYSSARLEQDRQTLTILLDNMNKLFFGAGDVWPLTPNLDLCKLCRYRSLCDRGREAGAYDEIEDDEVVPPESPEIATPSDFVL